MIIVVCPPDDELMFDGFPSRCARHQVQRVVASSGAPRLTVEYDDGGRYESEEIFVFAVCPTCAPQQLRFRLVPAPTYSKDELSAIGRGLASWETNDADSQGR